MKGLVTDAENVQITRYISEIKPRPAPEREDIIVRVLNKYLRVTHISGTPIRTQ
jgi:hypothetical protein